MSLTLTEDQHRSLWKSLATIRAAMGDLMLVADAYQIIGLGDLCRRVEDDRTKANQAAVAIASVLQQAAEQTEQRV